MGSDLSSRRLAVLWDNTPLPPGYSYRPNRRVTFHDAIPTDGLRGLAWAILLSAVADGCNPRWLAELADYYQIEVNPEMFYRQPAKGVLQDVNGNYVRDDDLGAEVKRSRTVHPMLKGVEVPNKAVNALIHRNLTAES